jgi:hypothetical protein
MKVVIYESSSKGGCYEYAQYLFRFFIKKNVDVVLVLPAKSQLSSILNESMPIHKILFNDTFAATNKYISKFIFLLKQFYNPIRFIFYLWRKPASIVIWNDFEQLSAPIWVLFLKVFASHHTHAIVLHDPDRDNYPPFKWYSEYTMKLIMGVMDNAYYHDYLPHKKYYQNGLTTYSSIIHGVFDKHVADPVLLNQLNAIKGDDIVLAILGNIREEKNYKCIIESLMYLPQTKLLIAGAPANSSVDVELLKQFAKEKGVYHKIIWYIRFLTDQELVACIEVSNTILLYYQPQFTSQSGILNLIAPYRKNFVYSDMESGLKKVCKKYSIGTPCKPNSIPDLVDCIVKINNTSDFELASNWDNYLKTADWSSINTSLQLNTKHG